MNARGSSRWRAGLCDAERAFNRPYSCRGSRSSPVYWQWIQLLFRQFAEPMQRDRRLRIVHFMTAVESPDSNALEAGSFDLNSHVVLLFYRRNPIIAPRANVDR